MAELMMKRTDWPRAVGGLTRFQSYS